MDVVKAMMNIDRRIIYLLLFIVAVIPFIFPIGMPVNVTPEVKSVYDYIEKLPPDKPVMISIDYDPQTQAENDPQARAIMRHCFARHKKVIVLATYPTNVGVAELAIKETSKEFGAKNGIDWCFLGYKPGVQIIMMQMGENIHKAFPTDYYGTPLDKIPMMKNIVNYNDIGLIVSVSASSIADAWVAYAHERYGAPLALAVTAVSGPQYYVYVQSKQIVGLLGGLKAAAEYETLLKDEYKRVGAKLKAIQGMDVQSLTHMLIIFFIILGNIGYFITIARKSR